MVGFWVGHEVGIREGHEVVVVVSRVGTKVGISVGNSVSSVP